MEALEVDASELRAQDQGGIILKKMGRGVSERETRTVRCEPPKDAHYKSTDFSF